MLTIWGIWLEAMLDYSKKVENVRSFLLKLNLRESEAIKTTVYVNQIRNFYEFFSNASSNIGTIILN